MAHKGSCVRGLVAEYCSCIRGALHSIPSNTSFEKPDRFVTTLFFLCDFAPSQAPAMLLLPQRHKTHRANLMNKSSKTVKVNSSLQADYLRFTLQLHKANKIANRYTLFKKLLLGWIT